jgi:hypothetical protein
VAPLESIQLINQRIKIMTTSLATEIANDSIVATYGSHNEAEAAVKELQQSGFDMKRLSIVGRDFHTDEQVVGYYNTGDRMKAWGTVGAFWGWVWGVLFGSAIFLIPGVGPMMVGGPLVAWTIAALENALVVGGVSAIGAGLLSVGIPRNSVLKYDTALKAGKFLLIAHGSGHETSRAKDILHRTNPESLDNNE